MAAEVGSSVVATETLMNPVEAKNSQDESPKMVRFNDEIEELPPDLGETDQDEEQRWFSVGFPA